MGVGGVVPWVLSGQGWAGLRGQAGRLREFVEGDPELEAMDVGFSLAGRAVFEDRAVVLGGGREELLGGLRALEAGEPSGWRSAGLERRWPGGTGLVFLFPGQGAQRVGMGLGVV